MYNKPVVFVFLSCITLFPSSGIGTSGYDKNWAGVSEKLLSQVRIYFKEIDFDFLQDKMTRELASGNAGGPQIRSKFDPSKTNERLAEASIKGLRLLLTIKTIENAFPFTEKTRVTDDSMLTDLAWHSFMLKPHKYYLVTHTIIKLLEEYGLGKREIPDFVLNDTIRAVNQQLKDKTLAILDEEVDTTRTPGRRVGKPKLIRHGTDKDLKIDVDVRNVIKNRLGYDDMKGDEWNMPLPLFIELPLPNTSALR